MTPVEILTNSAIYCGVFLMVIGCLMLLYMLFSLFFSVGYGDDNDL